MTIALKRIAYHEAGHAVCAALSGVLFESVSVKQNSDTLGRFVGEDFFNPKNAEEARTQALICHAGVVAEVILTGDPDVFASDHYIEDFEQAFSCLKEAGVIGENGYWDGLEYELTDAAVEFLRKPSTWAMVERLAGALIEKETLTFDEALDVMMEATHWPKEIDSEVKP